MRTYLLYRCVPNSVGIVIVVNDIQIHHCLSWHWAAELHIQWCFSSSLGEHSEVSWFATFYTWRKMLILIYTQLTHRNSSQEAFSTNKAQSSKMPKEKALFPTAWHPTLLLHIPAMLSQVVTILQQFLMIQYWSHYMNPALTSFVQPRSFSFHFAGIVRGVHFNSEWAGRNFLQQKHNSKNNQVT